MLDSRLFRLLLLVHAAHLPELMRGRVPLEALGRGPALASPAGLDRADAVRQVRDVGVAALGAQLVEGPLEPEQVVSVEPAGPFAGVDVLGEGLGVLGARKLVVVGRADVDEGADCRGRPAVGPVEGRVVDRVPVDLPDVEVRLHLGHPVRPDPVRGTPHLIRRRVVGVGQGGPEGALDERDDAAGRLGGASVVLAGLRLSC